MACKRVSEKMGCDPFRDTCSPAIGFDILPELLSAHRPAQTVEKKKGTFFPFG
jgi:hypothetical protein